MPNEESHLDRTIRWMSHDVKICMAHDAFVGAMTLMMSHISALAGYYAGRVKERPDNDHDEFMQFYRVYFKAFPDIQHTVKTRSGFKTMSLIYTHFRNGLIHEHLMKKGTALDQGLSKPEFYLESQSGLIVLNVDHFFADYLRAIAEYSNDVKFDRKPGIKQKFIDRSKYLGAGEPII